jgi:hypothetical protein
MVADTGAAGRVAAATRAGRELVGLGVGVLPRSRGRVGSAGE